MSALLIWTPSARIILVQASYLWAVSLATWLALWIL